MDEPKGYQLNEEELLEEEYELSHTDKIVGLFSEPTKIFPKIAKAPFKTVDWILPLVIFIVMYSLSTVIMQTNPQIRYLTIEKQTEAIEKSFSGAVNSGQITQEQAGAQIELIREKMESGGIAILIPQIISIVFSTLLKFFVISGFYFAISIFILKGNGLYGDAMVAYGLPFYILVWQVVIQLIFAMLMNKIITDLSVTTFLNLDKTEFVGFLLSKLDLLSIWFYVVVGIAFAKMFKSKNTAKYIGMTVGLWFGLTLLFFFLSSIFPFLGFLN